MLDTDDRTYRALCALREAPDPCAPEVRRHWAVLLAAVRRFARRVGGGSFADREDVEAESLLKLHRSLPSIQADGEAGTLGYIKQVVRTTHLDQVRARQRRRERFDGDSAGADRGEGVLARQEAPEPPDPRLHDPARLAPFEDALWDRVDAYLEANVRPHARVRARERAHVAYERIVRQRSAEELLAEIDRDVKLDTLYQWVHRGREDVLIPVVAEWAAEDDGDAEEREFAAALLGVLQGQARSDAGRPRPNRRKKGGNDDDGGDDGQGEGS